MRRFMTATDFLDRRAGQQELGPATWGWRGGVRRMTGGLVKPRMGPAERQHVQDRAAIQRDFDGPRTIAFINPKGGAAKTTGVLAAGYTFGTVRGGGVIAWDNNETRGTLGIRGTRSTPPQHHPRAARGPRPVPGRLPVADRRPRCVRPLAGRRALRRAGLRRAARRHRADPRRGLRRRPPAARALLPDPDRRHRQQHAGRELAGRRRRGRPARGHLDGARGHRLLGALDAGRPPGRRLPEPQVQDGDRALGPVAQGRREARRRT